MLKGEIERMNQAVKDMLEEAKVLKRQGIEAK